MTGDARLERLLADVLAADAPSSAPDRLLLESLRAARRVRRWPRWLAFLKEPPMRTTSHVAVGSPAVRVAFALALTLLLAVLATGAVVGSAALLAGPAIIVVDPAGAGTTTTIAAAVAMAQDGDTIQVRPGTYAEHIIIDKDIALEGDGPRGAVVDPYDADSPTATSACTAKLPNAVTVEDAHVTLRHLSIEGLEYGIGIQVSGGDVLLDDLSIVLPGFYHEREGGGGRWAISFCRSATGTVRNVTARGYIAVFEGSAPTIEHVQMIQDTVWLDGSGADTIVRDSELPWLYSQGFPLGTVTGNRIVGSVEVNGALEIAGNTLSADGNHDGLVVVTGNPRIVGNTIAGKLNGIQIDPGASALIEGNTITDNTTGVLVKEGAANTLSISGNTFCRNATDLDAPAGSGLTLEGNEICQAGASDAP